MFNNTSYQAFFEFAERVITLSNQLVEMLDQMKVSHVLLFMAAMALVHFFFVPFVLQAWRLLLSSAWFGGLYLIVKPTSWVVGRVMYWIYVRDIPLEIAEVDSTIIASSFGYDSLGPHVKAMVDGVMRRIDIEPLLAINMKVTVGKESPMTGSIMVPHVGIPKGTFTFHVNEQFVGCGFRLAVKGNYFLVTAKHVFDKFGIGNDVTIRYGTRVMRFYPCLIGSGEDSDFVLFKDDFLVGQFIKTLSGGGYVLNSNISVIGTANGGTWYKTQGVTTPSKSRAFSFFHQATTQPGWSGCPIFDKNNKVVGVHTGSVTEDDRVLNEATGIYDLISAMLAATKTKVVTKESFEEYDSPVWRPTTIKGSPTIRPDKLTFNGVVLQLNSNSWNFEIDTWDSDDEEMDFTKPFDYSDAKESAKADFQSRLRSGDRRHASNCTSSEDMSKKLADLQKLKLKQTESSRTAGKETARSQSINQDRSTQSTTSSQKQEGSTGRKETGKDFSSHWATMVVSTNLIERSQMLEWLEEPSRRLSKRLSKELKGILVAKLEYPSQLTTLVSLTVLRELMVQKLSAL
jgi:hypothetical protein